MRDLIDRRAAIDAIAREQSLVERPITETRWFDLGLRKAQEVLSKLPSAQPERKKGKWFSWDSDSNMYDDISCPFCNANFTVDAERRMDIGFTADDLKFCPNCGADMRGEE